MVAECNLFCQLQQWRRVVTDDFRPVIGVLAHQFPFRIIEFGFFQQDAVRYADFSNVMHGGGVVYQVDPFRVTVDRRGEQAGVVAHANNVQPGFIILVFSRTPQAADDLQAGEIEFCSAFTNLEFQFTVLVIQGQVGVYPGLYDCGVDRLGNVIHRTQRQAFLFILHGRFGGNEYHRYSGGEGVALEHFANLVTVHFRHHDIQQDHVRLGVAVGDFQGTFAVECGLDLVRWS